MFSIYALGLAIFEQADALNSLGIALLLISLPNVFCAMDVGLLLSAAATLGIILLSQPMMDFLGRFLPRKRWAERGLRAVYDVTAVSVSASLFTMPILILVFGQFSTYSLLTNLLLFFAPNIILFCTPLTVLFTLLHLDFLAAPLLFADGLAAKYMVFCTQKISGLPYAFVSVEENYLQLALAFCLMLIALWLLLAPGDRKLLRLVAVCCIVLMMAGVTSHAIFERGVTRVYFMEDEQGASALVLQDGHAALIGCGSEKNSSLRRLLSSKMIGRLEAVVFPSLDDVYAGGAGKILDAREAAVLYAPEGGAHRSELECRQDISDLRPLPLEPTELWEGVTVYWDDGPGALILGIGEGNIAFLVPGEQTDQLVSCSIAAAPTRLASPPAATILLTGEDIPTAASLAAQGAAVYTASPDGALCVASRGGNQMTIRRI